MSEDRLNQDVTVFLKIMDRGFNLSVPIEQEKYYRRGYDYFKRIVEKYKEKNHDEIEAIALTSIDCIVALQRSHEQLEEQKAFLERRVEDWNDRLERALRKE